MKSLWFPIALYGAFRVTKAIPVSPGTSTLQFEPVRSESSPVSSSTTSSSRDPRWSPQGSSHSGKQPFTSVETSSSFRSKLPPTTKENQETSGPKGVKARAVESSSSIPAHATKDKATRRVSRPRQAKATAEMSQRPSTITTNQKGKGEGRGRPLKKNNEIVDFTLPHMQVFRSKRQGETSEQYRNRKRVHEFKVKNQLKERAELGLHFPGGSAPEDVWNAYRRQTRDEKNLRYHQLRYEPQNPRTPRLRAPSEPRPRGLENKRLEVLKQLESTPDHPELLQKAVRLGMNPEQPKDIYKNHQKRRTRMSDFVEIWKAKQSGSSAPQPSTPGSSAVGEGQVSRKKRTADKAASQESRADLLPLKHPRRKRSRVVQAARGPASPGTSRSRVDETLTSIFGENHSDPALDPRR